jgi:hypothetical protein
MQFPDFLNALASNTVVSNFVAWLLMYGASLLGAVLMYFFADRNGLEGTVPKLRLLLPGRSDTYYFRLDFVLLILVGPVVGLICFAPTNPFQALASGCGWVGALNVLLQQKPPIAPVNPASPDGDPPR